MSRYIAALLNSVTFVPPSDDSTLNVVNRVVIGTAEARKTRNRSDEFRRQAAMRDSPDLAVGNRLAEA